MNFDYFYPFPTRIFGNNIGTQTSRLDLAQHLPLLVVEVHVL